MNYAVAGSAEKPALLLIPGQTESWWGYEQAMPLLAEHFQAFAVDLRGQGRSTRTPGRYTLDNMGNDLVRFIDGAIGRPTIVSGLSSGGVLAAWLSAYAKPGQVIGALYEDPPLFASRAPSRMRPVDPPVHRPDVRALEQVPRRPVEHRRLGRHGRRGSARAACRGSPRSSPPWRGAEPPQNLKEYDPEWARAFWTGTVTASCDHERMLASVKVPVLLTHHFRKVDDATGDLLGALSDTQAARVRALIECRGRHGRLPVVPDVGHSMHGQDPRLFADTLTRWAATLP